jgi:hypothetical protein
MIRPATHSNNEEWIKPGIEETCIIRAFALRLQEISWLLPGQGQIFLTREAQRT